MVRNRLVICTFVVLLAPSQSACVRVPAPVVHPEREGQEERVELVGRAVVSATPEFATITVSVRERAATAQEATRSASAVVNKVMNELKLKGLKDEDFRTSEVALDEETGEPQAPSMMTKASVVHTSTATKSRFVARNTIKVVVRDPSVVGTLLGKMADAGINQIQGVEFGVERLDELRQRARDLAVADARKQARALAKGAGLELGRIVSIVAQDGEGRAGFSSTPIVRRGAWITGSVPVLPGSLEIEQLVRVRFALLP